MPFREDFLETREVHATNSFQRGKMAVKLSLFTVLGRFVRGLFVFDPIRPRKNIVHNIIGF